MHITVYEKNPKFRTCWYAYKLPNIIAWYPLFDAAHAKTGSTHYQSTYCYNFTKMLSYFTY